MEAVVARIKMQSMTYLREGRGQAELRCGLERLLIRWVSRVAATGCDWKPGFQSECLPPKHQAPIYELEKTSQTLKESNIEQQCARDKQLRGGHPPLCKIQLASLGHRQAWPGGEPFCHQFQTIFGLEERWRRPPLNQSSDTAPDSQLSGHFLVRAICGKLFTSYPPARGFFFH